MKNKDLGASVGPGSRAGTEPQGVSAVPASIPRAGPERISVEEFHARLKSQRVSANRHFALICPMCGTVQSMASLVAAGATPERAERLIGYSCEGRLTGAGPWPNKPSAKRRAVRGCDWTLGGLFRIHKLEVVDGQDVFPRFEIASPSQAQDLASAIEARRAETTQIGSVADESAVRQETPNE